jgi:TRAP-type C4-dicarboxylate transport system substrate-binding protein
MKKTLLIVTIMLFIMQSVSIVYSKEAIILKATAFLPRTDDNLTAWWALVEDINKKAKGELKIKFIGGPEAIPGFKQFEAVRNGVVDIIFGCESYYGRQITGAAFTHLTRLGPIEERENGYYDFRVKQLKEHNLQYLGRPLCGEWFHIFTNKSVSSPQELKGQKIRVSATYEAFVKSLGAVPITMPGSDIYTALERGTIDGYAWAIIGNVKAGRVDVCKYIIEPRIYQMNIETLVNLDTWQKLPVHLQKLLTNCSIENEKKYTKIMKEMGEKEYLDMQNRGMKVIKFSPEDTKWYIDLAYKSAWDDVIKENPTLGPKLKDLLTP